MRLQATEEPRPDVIITAHNAGDSPGYGPRWGAIFARNLAASVGESEWVNRVPASGIAP